jgi:hypothetical protein
MNRRSRLAGVIAALLAIAGIVLAVEARHAGSLFRYQLAGYVAATFLCLPFLLWCGTPHLRRFGRRVAFVLLPLLAALLLLEAAVRWAGPTPVPKGAVVADARLGHVMVPFSDATDARGFRNPEALTKVDVLFVGDSQTWGYHVDAAATASRAFATTTGASAYQMSNGSYGPVQYVELVRQGLALAPRAVVVLLYFGNDIVDAADYTGLLGAASLGTEGRPARHRRNPELDGEAAPNWTMALVDGALAKSRVLEFAANVVKSRLQGGVLDTQPGAVAFTHAAVPTVLLPDYRFGTVDPNNEMVRDGLMVTARSLRAIAEQCTAAKTRLLWLLIPTKETAYAEWQAGLGTPLPPLTRLHAAEASARSTVIAAAVAVGVEVHDLLPDCVSALQAGNAIWPVGSDGHLNAAGHALIAAVVARWWQRP